MALIGPTEYSYLLIHFSKSCHFRPEKQTRESSNNSFFGQFFFRTQRRPTLTVTRQVLFRFYFHPSTSAWFNSISISFNHFGRWGKASPTKKLLWMHQWKKLKLPFSQLNYILLQPCGIFKISRRTIKRRNSTKSKQGGRRFVRKSLDSLQRLARSKCLKRKWFCNPCWKRNESTDGQFRYQHPHRRRRRLVL